MHSLRFTVPLLLSLVILLFLQSGLVEATGDPEIAVSSGVELSSSASGAVRDINYLPETDPYMHTTPDRNLSTAGPNDPLLAEQWAFRLIGTPPTWHTAASPLRVVTVAVLDTGIDKDHPDLYGKVAAEIDFTGSGSPHDFHGHGTHIAGIIAAGINNATGIAGLAPDSRLFNVKVADDRGRCQASVVAAGIRWAVDNGADIINLSLEIREPDAALRNAIDYAWDHGVLIIAAGSNVTASAPTYPAFFAHTISVVAARPDGSIGPMLTYPDWIDLAAPGFNIISTLPSNRYGQRSGTSMAAAHVSGLAALLLSGIPQNFNSGNRLNEEIREIILRSSRPTPSGEIKLIDIPAALTAVEMLLPAAYP